MTKIFFEKDIILPIYNENHSINKTAKILNISWNTCKRILNEYGVETLKQSNQYGSYQTLNLFDSIRTQEDAYWLGILYSDGWIRSDRNSIGLGTVDKDLIEKFKQYTNSTNTIQIKDSISKIGKSLPDNRVVKTAKTFYTLEFSSKSTKENLIKLGCFPKKSLILQCPTEEQVNQELLHHFLRGYIDGDGWIGYNKEKNKYYIGFLGTQNFLQGITNRLKINHYGSIHKKENTKSTFSFEIYKKQLVEKVLHLLYDDATIYMDRKYEKYTNLIGRSPI